MAHSRISPLRSLASPTEFSRRELLWFGSVGVAASVLPGSVFGEGGPADFQPLSTRTADAVIYLWMGGGVTHIDSFDPKPEAPEEIRGTLSAISTTLPGIQFGEPMPHLAKLAHELCLIRSFSHDSDDHLLSQAFTLCGRKVTQAQLFSEPNIGSIVAKLNGPRNGLPGYIAVPGITRPGPPPNNLFVGGWLGNQFAPFAVGGIPEQPDFTVGHKLPNPPAEHDEDLNPQALKPATSLPTSRITRRASLKEQLDGTLASVERLANRGGHYQDAVGLLTNPDVRNAFDVSQETPTIRDQYGRTKIGQRCLMARRLVEAGARYVMVDYGYDPDYGNLWDNHNAPTQNMPHISEICRRGYHLAGIDKAFAALISDLKTRGQLERTLVVFLTEFGRTPKINANGGRDHWGRCGSIFLTGGGTQTGQVIGASDAQAAYPTTIPHGPADVAATIYHALGIPLEHRIPDIQGRPHAVLDEGTVIAGVFGNA